ncbi:MAG: DUF4387 domain-containing protein [Gammaproteobacteria bacterium]|nr:DUF4387 domain-containing protein [Gammaproteobacteria bacterium]
MKNLSQVASVIRSKNAGPFIVTFDILFESKDVYDAVKEAGLVTRASVCELYGVSDNELLGFEYYPFAHAIKFSLRRPVGSGGPGDADVYGAQQHAPLLDMPALDS